MRKVGRKAVVPCLGLIIGKLMKLPC